jgi:hypothetical protein
MLLRFGVTQLLLLSCATQLLLLFSATRLLLLFSATQLLLLFSAAQLPFGSLAKAGSSCASIGDVDWKILMS